MLSQTARCDRLVDEFGACSCSKEKACLPCIFFLRFLGQNPASGTRCLSTPFLPSPHTHTLPEGPLTALHMLGTAQCLNLSGPVKTTTALLGSQSLGEGCGPHPAPWLVGAGKGRCPVCLALQKEHLGCRCSSLASRAAGLGHVSFPEPPMWRF